LKLAKTIFSAVFFKISNMTKITFLLQWNISDC